MTPDIRNTICTASSPWRSCSTLIREGEQCGQQLYIVICTFRVILVMLTYVYVRALFRRERTDHALHRYF